MNDSTTPAQTDADGRDTETIDGVLERVVYTNEENGWSVVRLVLPDRRAPQTAVGNLLGARPGEHLRLTGTWVKDSKYGRQFQVSSFLAIEPQTVDGMRKFLGSGLINGIGPAMAGRLVDRFGLETLDVIENEPEKLRQVDGIGPVRVERIQKAYVEQRDLRDAMVFLQGYGVSAGLAVRICQRYGERTVAVVRENPYRLAAELFGVGFKTADRIASSLGFEETSPERIAAGLLHTLDQAADDGHMFLPHDKLIQWSADLLGVDVSLCEQAIRQLEESTRIVIVPRPGKRSEAIYKPDLLRAETGTVTEIERLLSADREGPDIQVDRAIIWYEQREGFELAELQREAIRRGLTDRIAVITGGPGTGKTTLVRAIAEILGRKGQRLLLAAPTGRAAKRLAESTGLEARTIHRLLEFDPHRHGFQRGPGRPLEADVVIVDEVSMVDCVLAHLLLGALPSGCRLLLLGDADQLPSVGPGRVLRDLIASERIPVVPLTEIFRQARSSLIVRNAHLVNHGELPVLDDAVQGSDFFYIERDQPDEILATLLHLVSERIPKGLGFDPLREIQLLTPMRRGLLGTNNLNEELQRLLNPSGLEMQRRGTTLRVGDRVMQIRNNYELGVFNGDVGRIREIDVEELTLEVDYGDRTVQYESGELDELVLAYACSVHKSQGSEYPCVVLPLHTQHHVMLQRNLLYTALTRAQRLAVLVGSRQAIRTAVRNHRPQRRFTLLAERLAGEIPG